MSSAMQMILKKFLETVPKPSKEEPGYITELYSFDDRGGHVLVRLGYSAVMTIWPNGNHTWHTAGDHRRLFNDVANAARKKIEEGVK